MANLDAEQIAVEVGMELKKAPVDLAFVGIGENGHIAFNDPPADFETEEPYILVTLDEACRRQQVNEGWFATMADVPTRAISMLVRQILQVNEIIAIVPDARKAAGGEGVFGGRDRVYASSFDFARACRIRRYIWTKVQRLY